MKVLVINGSPRAERAATVGALNPFMEGMKGAGAEVELVHVQKLNLRPCRGCFNCWWETPGACVQDDKMKDVLPKLADADVWVFATPVYVDGMTGTIKTFMDRMIPLLEGRWEIRDDHCRHPLREGTKPGKIVLLSVSGFTELDNFEPLVAHMKAASKNMGREFVGAVLRPCAWVIPHLVKRGMPVDDVVSALRDAGQQLVKSGEMSSETLDIISRELIPREQIFEMYG